jgi:RNA polymerase sigma-70 factor (ECF subfamily)
LLIDKDQIDAAAWLDGRRKLALLAQAVAHLPPQCRKAFLLRRIDGMEYKEIAKQMNISVSCVEKHVANGLLKCNVFLRARGYDPSEFSAPPAPGNPQPAERMTHNFARVNAKDERD